MRIITFGTYDLFHLGHLRILERAKKYNNEENILIVGVSSDELNFNKKQKYPHINLEERKEIISSIKYVDTVFTEHSLDDKLKYCREYNADILIMGDDHLNEYDFLKNYDIDVVYFPRTENISTTEITYNIRNT